MLTQIMTIIISSLIILGLTILKNNNKELFNKILKLITIIYLIIVFSSIFLPDGLIMTVEEDTLYRLEGINKFYLVIRMFKAIILPSMIISIFSNHKYFKNIMVFIALPTAIISLCLYNQYMNYYLMETGKGLNSINWLSEEFKMLLLSKIFRSIIFGIEWGLVIIICMMIALNQFKIIKSLKEIILTIIIIICLLFQFMPIYIPQLLFEGFSNIIFNSFKITHFIWMFYIIGKILLIYFIFRKTSDQTKFIVCLILSLATLIQYNTMFSLTINIKRLPFQLCNLAAYLIPLTLIIKSKKLFNFNFLVNVLGAFLALMFPDVNGRGILEVWNMHFIYEHTNIMVIPILCLLFKLFNNIDKTTLKDALIGFGIYFIFCALIGSTFNILSAVKNNPEFEVNYLFMFDMDKALGVLPFLEPLTKITLNIYQKELYPLIMLVVLFGYSSFILIFYLIIVGIKYLKNKNKVLD